MGLIIKKTGVIVIGAGAAGMMAAATAGARGLDVVLLEKNPASGEKMLLTGNGRCNLTNTAALDEMIARVNTNGKFLRNAFLAFSNNDLISLINKLGVPTKVEPGGRVFPASGKAADVVRALKRYLAQNNVKIVRGDAAKVLAENGEARGVRLKDGRVIFSSKVIVATGGVSYPATGSTGDGHRFARELGHTVTRLRPALVPLELKDNWVSEAQGVSLRQAGVCVRDSRKKKLFACEGGIMFTHYGISGPVILSASSHLRRIGQEQYSVVIDMVPAEPEAELDAALIRFIKANPTRHFENIVGAFIPAKLAEILIGRAGIGTGRRANQVTRAGRAGVVWLMKHLELAVAGLRPIEEAMVTAGGVEAGEIKPRTMESRLVKGVFFAGEVLDVDADTGGFNLQAAFSTGHLAGMNC